MYCTVWYCKECMCASAGGASGYQVGQALGTVETPYSKMPDM